MRCVSFCDVVSTSSASPSDSIVSIDTIRRSGWVFIPCRATFSMRLRIRLRFPATELPRIINLPWASKRLTCSHAGQKPHCRRSSISSVR